MQILAPVVRARKGRTRQESWRTRAKAVLCGCGSMAACTIFPKRSNWKKTKNTTSKWWWTASCLREDIQRRLTDSVETAASLSGGLVIVDLPGQGEVLFSQNYACEDCGISIEELTPRLFSFNNPYGACPECTGLGMKLEIDPDRIIPNRGLSILQGAVKAPGWNSLDDGSIARMYFDALSKKYGFALDVPVKDLPKEAVDVVLYGTKGEPLDLHWKKAGGGGHYVQPFEGIIKNLERRYSETTSESAREEIEECMSRYPLPGLPRQAAQARGSGGDGGRHQHRRLFRPFRHPRPGIHQWPAADGAGEHDRLPHPQGDPGTAGLFAERGPGVS